MSKLEQTEIILFRFMSNKKNFKRNNGRLTKRISLFMISKLRLISAIKLDAITLELLKKQKESKVEVISSITF